MATMTSIETKLFCCEATSSQQGAFGGGLVGGEVLERRRSPAGAGQFFATRTLRFCTIRKPVVFWPCTYVEHGLHGAVLGGRLGGGRERACQGCAKAARLRRSRSGGKAEGSS